MILSYEEFLYLNKDSTGKERYTIVSAKLSKNTCTLLGKDRLERTVPLPILLLLVARGRVHVNDAYRLKNWNGWGSAIPYPEDTGKTTKDYMEMLKES